MKIVHVISTPDGVAGAERVLASLLRGGRDRRCDQFVLNPFASAAAGSELERICLEADPDLCFEALPCPSPGLVPGLRRRLSRRLESHRPDIVHAHLFHAAVLCGSLGQRPATTVLTHHHGDHNVAEGRRFRAMLDRRYGGRFDSVVAISDYVHEFLVDGFGYPEAKVSTIRNGWSGRPLPPVPHPNPTVVCVARLRKQKGHAELIRAFAKVREEIPGARLRLIGDGPLRIELERLVCEGGLEGSVIFEGVVEDVWPVLAEADLFALASHYEPLGLAVIEAMAAGLPVVATSVGGIPELVDSEVGALVAPRETNRMAAAITAILRSTQRDAIGRCARARSLRMTAAEMTDSYFDLYGAA